MLQSFFKTAPGEYGEGDVFLGVTVPGTRSVAKPFRDLPLAEIRKLLRSKIHEERLLALLILVDQFARAEAPLREKLFDFYVANLSRVNNWDLVDLSAERIIGPWLAGRSKTLLYTLARSPRLWDRRVAILSTFHFIRNRDFKDTLKLAEVLLRDKEDLMHKAVGWMLREVGNRNLPTLERFLRRYAPRMPRTMLRYAIEKLPPSKRKRYMSMRTPHNR